MEKTSKPSTSSLTTQLSNSEQKSYNRESMLQKFIGLMRAKNADVQFIFDCDEKIIKLPAHKEVLSAWSPVFDAMFNGELKEKGNVEIVDATPGAFEEFLQFFYGNQMKLTMDNVADVLQLVDKYDVGDCFEICVDFLKQNLTTDYVLWGLNLALRFQLDDLQAHCTKKIQKNFKKVWDMFDIRTDGKVRLISNPDDHFLCDKDIENILQHVCVISKKIVFNLSDQVSRLRERRVSPFVLVNIAEKEKIIEYEILRFSLTGPMLLTDIFCSKVFEFWGADVYKVVNHQVELCIEEWQTGTLFSAQFYLTDSDNHVKLNEPIIIEEGRTYAIIMKSATLWTSRYTYQANLPGEGVVLTPGVKISFPNADVVEKYTHSLISHLYFERIIVDD